MRRRLFVWFGLAGASALLAGGAVWRAFVADIDQARASTRERSQVFEAASGQWDMPKLGPARRS